MKRWILATVWLLMLVSMVPGSLASEPARTFMAGIDAYQGGNWPAAIEVQLRVYPLCARVELTANNPEPA